MPRFPRQQIGLDRQLRVAVTIVGPLTSVPPQERVCVIGDGPYCLCVAGTRVVSHRAVVNL